MKKRILSLLIAIVMVVGLLPTVAFAEGTAVAKIGDHEYTTFNKAFNAAGDGDTITVLPGEYSSVAFYLHGKKNISLVAEGDVTINGKLEIGYHSNQDASSPLKENSKLTVKGFTVKGELRVDAADQEVVVENNKAAQITVKTFKIDGMKIKIANNTLDGTLGSAPQGYGIYVVPNATNYDLNICGNTFQNIQSHVIAIQGCGDGGAVTTANSLTVTDNAFESWGLNEKPDRAAFKIWSDTKWAPNTLDRNEFVRVPDETKALLTEIATQNTYPDVLPSNTVLANIFDAVVDPSDVLPPDDTPTIPGFIPGIIAGGASQMQHFVDVTSMEYYYDAVQWAADSGIATGTSSLLFSPDKPCTRAQAVTFLWRALGCPAAEKAANFTDVKAGAYYADAVAWAVENGVTVGTSDTTFSPDAPCTRAQIVTFLYRAIGEKSTVDAGFSDVPANAYYADAVNWAAQYGITGGTGANRFSPDMTCTRAQIVTFLYRAN